MKLHKSVYLGIVCLVLLAAAHISCNANGDSTMKKDILDLSTQLQEKVLGIDLKFDYLLI